MTPVLLIVDLIHVVQNKWFVLAIIINVLLALCGTTYAFNLSFLLLLGKHALHILLEGRLH